MVACGILKVPYPRFVTAHLTGSSVYVAVYLGLGAAIGPGFLAALHLSAIAVRLIWLLPLAAGIPLLASAATFAKLLGAPRSVDPAYALVGWISGPGLDVDATVRSLYAMLLALLVATSIVYYALLPGRLTRDKAPLLWQVGGLAGTVALLLLILSLAPLFVLSDEASYLTASGGWLTTLSGVALGAVAYATTVVHGRVLAVCKSSKARTVG